MSEMSDIIAAIKSLEKTQQKHLNRLMACEALGHALIQLMDPPLLEILGEEYENSLLRLAENLEPKFQQPELWENFSDAIKELQSFLARQNGLAGTSVAN